MDYKIVIDAGHGGEDSGASGNGIVEKNMTLAISEYMYDRLRELGVPVKLIRSTDETITPSQRTNRILDAFGNSRDVIVISNHINAGGGEGAEVIYALRNNSDLANNILDELQNEGQIIRKAYQRRLPSNTSKDYYFIHRDTGITQPVIIEYGFLDNVNDANKLKSNYLRYAEAATRALLQYIGYGEANDDTYTVQKGESLWSIAKKFNVTVEELKLVNNLTSNLLSVGQKLVIPKEEEPEPGEYTIYIVKAGDNLYSIAKRYDINVNDLIKYNNLSTTGLSIGQQLLIPAISNNQDEYDTYIVQSGDTLYQIARRFNTDTDKLMDINNLSSNILTIGQKILVPKTNEPISSDEINYVVKKGDNLYTIANKYGISVNELKNYNNLSTSALQIGQVLKIPTPSGITYIVKSGDNLYSIASKYNTTVDELKKKNNLSGNNLSIGQILII